MKTSPDEFWVEDITYPKGFEQLWKKNNDGVWHPQWKFRRILPSDTSQVSIRVNIIRK